MPATRATANTSPLVIAPEAMADTVLGSMYTRHRATARRCVASLEVTSTIGARRGGSGCVNSEAGMGPESTTGLRAGLWGAETEAKRRQEAVTRRSDSSSDRGG